MTHRPCPLPTFLTLHVLLLTLVAGAARADILPGQSSVLTTMRLVADHWIAEHADPGYVGWARATYFFGHMATYATYPDSDYLAYAVQWGEQNDWILNGGPHTRHADNQGCGQTYIELYHIDPEPERIEDITTSVQGMVDSPECDDWWWIDALCMAMPVFTRLGVLYDDTDYFDKMYCLYADTKHSRGLYNAQWGLWHRDASYLPPASTPGGQPIFWSRGNGWVIAGHVRTLEYLPPGDPHRHEYTVTLLGMAAALKDVQRTDGFWNVSLADTLDYPGPETSGTSFFCYGIAWGILNGVLDEATYLPVVTRAWNGMTDIAIHPDGIVGYVQGIAGSPGGGQPVTYDSTTDFGVGAFLLAGSLVYRLAPATAVPQPGDNLAPDTLDGYSSATPGYPATQAADDDYASWWHADGYPQWIEVDLATVRDIGLVEVVPHDRRAYQYTIESKTTVDGEYRLLVDRSASTESGAVLADWFPPEQARFVKLTISGAHEYAGGDVAIHEFRVCAPHPTGVAPDRSADRPPTGPPDRSAEQVRDRDLEPVLAQNTPNPFNPRTTINFTVPTGVSGSAPVRVTIHDAAGRLVRVLVAGTRSPGRYTVAWNGRDAAGRLSASGVYYYRLDVAGRQQTRRMVLLR